MIVPAGSGQIVFAVGPAAPSAGMTPPAIPTELLG